MCVCVCVYYVCMYVCMYVYTGQVADKDVVGVNFSQLVLKVLSTQFTCFTSTTVQILAPRAQGTQFKL